jgi:hypothetical protein
MGEVGGGFVGALQKEKGQYHCIGVVGLPYRFVGQDKLLQLLNLELSAMPQQESTSILGGM